MSGAAGPGSAGSEGAAAILTDAPVALWPELLAAVRRAVDRIPAADLPTRLRPIAGFTPVRLAGDRTRAVIAAALASDARLRQVTGEALAPADESATEGADIERLRAVHGEQRAFAMLVTEARWGEVAVLAAAVGAERARAQRAAAEESAATRRREAEERVAREAAELEALRGEVVVLRARLERAEAAERGARRDGERAEEERSRADARIAELEGELERARRAGVRRVERAERRAEEAVARTRVDDARVAGVADRLEELTRELRGALRVPAPTEERVETGGAREGAPKERAGRVAPVAAVRQGIRAAAPGRPCAMPPGLLQESPAGVWSLLAVDGLRVLVDAYNVTKDPAGRPFLDLEAQRAWLLGLVGGLAPRIAARLRLVVDGTERHAGRAPVPKGVRVTFSEGEETADERLLAILRSLPLDAPVLVVSSDREVREGATARGANVVRSGIFLAAVDPEGVAAGP